MHGEKKVGGSVIVASMHDAAMTARRISLSQYGVRISLPR